eukprot:gene9857-8766_t
MADEDTDKIVATWKGSGYVNVGEAEEVKAQKLFTAFKRNVFLTGAVIGYNCIGYTSSNRFAHSLAACGLVPMRAPPDALSHCAGTGTSKTGGTSQQSLCAKVPTPAPRPRGPLEADLAASICPPCPHVPQSSRFVYCLGLSSARCQPCALYG